MDIENLYQKMTDEEIISKYKSSKEEVEILKKEVESRKLLNNYENIKEIEVLEKNKKIYELMSDIEIFVRYINIEGYICPNAKEIIKEEVKKRGLNNREVVKRNIGVLPMNSNKLQNYISPDETILFKTNLFVTREFMLLIISGMVIGNILFFLTSVNFKIDLFIWEFVLVWATYYKFIIKMNDKLIVTNKRVLYKGYKKIKIVNLNLIKNVYAASGSLPRDISNSSISILYGNSILLIEKQEYYKVARIEREIMSSLTHINKDTVLIDDEEINIAKGNYMTISTILTILNYLVILILTINFNWKI